MLSVKKFVEIDIDFDKLIEAESDIFYLKGNISFMNDYKNKALNYLLGMTLSTNNKQVLNKIEQAIDEVDYIMRCHIKKNLNSKKLKKYNINAYNKLKKINYDIKPYNYEY